LAVGGIVAIRPDVPVGPQADQFLRGRLPERGAHELVNSAQASFLTLSRSLVFKSRGDGLFTPASASWDFRTAGQVEIGFTAARLGSDGNTVAANLCWIWDWATGWRLRR
jgi:hypothetical protein